MSAFTIYNTFPGGPTRNGEYGQNRLPASESAGSQPATEDNLVTNAIREAIAEAQDAHQLLHISRTVIPKAMGITSDQRRELQTLVADKFTYLNIELSRREAAERL
jgi:hypothetical protein